MRLVIIGPPGAGKGTQAKLISHHFDIPHISTGDMLRENIAAGNEIGTLAKRYTEQGLLVPDDIVNCMVEERLSHPDATKGFLLDGYPRTVDQADALKLILAKKGNNLNAVINLEISREKLISRIAGRRICENCGASFNIITNPPRVSCICDNCGGRLIQRHDDNVDIAATRVDVYMKETKPLIDYYKSLSLLYVIDADRSIEQVFEDICNKLECDIE
ncbi:MAG: adenylate kinase [Thermoanaerobacteraceae bacterium]|nr:adenylate kinase [Thermoanaerobacteraceae bacterium]